MSTLMSSSPMRRSSLTMAALVAFAAAAVVTTVPTRTALAQKTAGHNWVSSLHGTHRQLFDAPAPNGGMPLLHMLNYYNTYNSAFQVSDADVDGILTLYGATTLFGVSDAMWAKYEIGAMLNVTDADGAPARRNPWRTNTLIEGMALPDASIEGLKRRGATFLLCNNALTFFAGAIAKARGLDTNAVYAELKANMLPEVTLVPAMVIAIEQAHQAGISYHRQ